MVFGYIDRQSLRPFYPLRNGVKAVGDESEITLIEIRNDVKRKYQLTHKILSEPNLPKATKGTNVVIQKNKAEVPKKGKPKPVITKSRAGRKKEKVQISVRIDKAVMDLAYAHIGRTGDRITDYLERGVILALREDMNLPAITSRVRFLVAHADPEEQNRVRHLLALLRMPRVHDLSPVEKMCRDATLMYLDVVEGQYTENGLYEKALAEYGEPPSPTPGSRELIPAA